MAGSEVCAERRRLLDLYGEAAQQLQVAARELAEVSIAYEADIFQRSWDRCEQAREKCAAARHKLMAHTEEHGCIFGLFHSAHSR